MGVRIATDNRDAVESAISSAIAASLEEIGSVAEGYAKRECPVDTGRLRNSITHQVEVGNLSGKAYIGTNVEYAEYVELGTFRQKAQPYLKPAAADHKAAYMSIVADNIGSVNLRYQKSPRAIFGNQLLEVAHAYGFGGSEIAV
jgi:HK97 gp10 family phage protein